MRAIVFGCVSPFVVLDNKMRIASVSMIKNECDIIELFFRVNSRYVDHFLVIDNGSSDSTVEIVGLLIKEGFPITLIREGGVGFLQEKLINRTLEEIKSMGGFDWAILLDADEFMLGERSDFESDLRQLPEAAYGKLTWKTFVPMTGNYASCANPLWELFRQREFEPNEYVKAVVPMSLVGQGRVSAGNHVFFKSNGKRFPAYEVGSGLAHVPIRSSSQIISKALLGSAALAQKKSRLPGEGFHWDELAGSARLHKYHFDSDKLKNLALSYAVSGVECPVGVIDDVHIGVEADVIRYPELIEVNLVARLDDYINHIISPIAPVNVPTRARFDWLSKFRARLGL